MPKSRSLKALVAQQLAMNQQKPQQTMAIMDPMLTSNAPGQSALPDPNRFAAAGTQQPKDITLESADASPRVGTTAASDLGEGFGPGSSPTGVGMKQKLNDLLSMAMRFMG